MPLDLKPVLEKPKLTRTNHASVGKEAWDYRGDAASNLARQVTSAAVTTPSSLQSAPTVGWRASHVYACDVRHDARSGRWLLYFNGRDVAALRRGREAIGFVVADP